MKFLNNGVSIYTMHNYLQLETIAIYFVLNILVRLVVFTLLTGNNLRQVQFKKYIIL